MTIHEAVAAATEQFQHISTTPELDAVVLLEAATGKPRSWILAHGEETLSEDALAQYRASSEHRMNGVPVAYVVGHKEFFGRDFLVNHHVLIPRPETELLIDEALAAVKRRQWLLPTILDIGTGSGCIGITLALELPGATVTATDISSEALGVAQENAHALDAQLTFRLGDLFDALPPSAAGSFDLIAINPPYVDIEALDMDTPIHAALMHEPRNALTPPGGMAVSLVLRSIAEAPQWLSPHGILLVEIGHDQGEAATHAAEDSFPQAQVRVKKDLNGFERLLIVEQ